MWNSRETAGKLLFITQTLTLSVSKLAGQCGKLKCCLNYELDTYLEAWDQFPSDKQVKLNLGFYVSLCMID